MIKIITTSSYEKRLKRFKQKHPDLKGRYTKTIKHLGLDPFHPSVRLHKLKGKLSEYYSVSINMQYRIMLDFLIKDDKVTLTDIGDHHFY